MKYTFLKLLQQPKYGAVIAWCPCDVIVTFSRIYISAARLRQRKKHNKSFTFNGK